MSPDDVKDAIDALVSVSARQLFELAQFQRQRIEWLEGEVRAQQQNVAHYEARTNYWRDAYLDAHADLADYKALWERRRETPLSPDEARIALDDLRRLS